MDLQESLKKKRFVVTSEIQPPLEEDFRELLENIEKIRGRLDALTVPEFDFEGVIADSIGTCSILRENKFNPILQTTTREKNRLDLQSFLVKASEKGVKNILAFTEDYRITGDSLQEIMFFHVDSGKLFSVLENLRDGHDVTGKDIRKAAEFFVGSGIDANHNENIPDLELKEMEEMVKLGTGYFLTTPVFDPEEFRKFMKRVEPFNIPVIAEVILLKSASTAHFINRHLKKGLVPAHIIQKLTRAPDKEKASIEIFTEIIKGLKDICQGIHLIPLGWEGKIPKFLDAVKL
ncbi:MAG: methylenetetrahydrofolate reductase [Spirochaetes bacterium RBG_16_49_21]|nr:MAG: methylenetetrahydrofolate reductase [Spirochaetes bacterium RBG_16_49_21]